MLFVILGKYKPYRRKMLMSKVVPRATRVIGVIFRVEIISGARLDVPYFAVLNC